MKGFRSITPQCGPRDTQNCYPCVEIPDMMMMIDGMNYIPVRRVGERRGLGGGGYKKGRSKRNDDD